MCRDQRPQSPIAVPNPTQGPVRSDNG